MPDHAGFAAAITVRERVLSDALLFAYSRPSFSRVRTIPFLGDGPLVAITAFLSPPTVTCDGTRNALVVGVDLTGALVFTGPQGKEAQPVVAHAEVAVPPAFELMAGQLSLTPRHTDVKVISWTYTVVGGTGFKPDTDAYLRSPLMLDRLSETVKVALDINAIPLPSVDVSSLGAIVDAAAPPPDTLALVPARVVDGALVAGLNVDGFMPPWQPPGHTGGIWLSGDTHALEDFAGEYDVAVVTNPDALPILLAAVEDQVVSAVGTDATLDSLRPVGRQRHLRRRGSGLEQPRPRHLLLLARPTPGRGAARRGDQLHREADRDPPEAVRRAVVLDRGHARRRLDGPLVLGHRSSSRSSPC